MKTKAELLHKSKLILNSGLVREIVIWKVPICHNYPQGIKYRLILVNPIWKKTLVLFDNHAPKGHHMHDQLGNTISYNFISAQLLIRDFLKFESLAEKEYESNEN